LLRAWEFGNGTEREEDRECEEENSRTHTTLSPLFIPERLEEKNRDVKRYICQLELTHGG
jgi:hypothetical protein